MSASLARRDEFFNFLSKENKADLVGQEFPPHANNRDAPIRTSALTGQGIPELRAAILQHVTGNAGGTRESGFLTNARHQSLVRDSLNAFDAATQTVHNRVPHEMLLLDLYNALRPLDEITGATTNDDILNLIFSRFCNWASRDFTSWNSDVSSLYWASGGNRV